MRRFRSLLAVVTLLGAAGFVAVRAPSAVDQSVERIRSAFRLAGDDCDAALARYRSPEYVAALKKVRRTVPDSEPYFLVEGTESGHDGWFVRFDLAPRPCVLLGRLSEKGTDPSFNRRHEHRFRFVVVARLHPPGPELIETSRFFEEADP